MFLPLIPTAKRLVQVLPRVYAWDMLREIADIETGSELSCFQLDKLTDMIEARQIAAEFHAIPWNF